MKLFFSKKMPNTYLKCDEVDPIQMFFFKKKTMPNTYLGYYKVDPIL
jgi:hypothetical protein